jgi:apolipoprotein N-acyltransferase
MPGGLTPGTRAEVAQVKGYRLAPNICFESVIPHVVRRQVAQLRARGEEPDILVNVTNDGWFWGSGILDLHLQCSVLRAIEHRKPVLIAANTGFSAHIDGNGVVQQLGPRRKTDVLYVEVLPDGRQSLYSRTGDVFGWACAIVTLVALAQGIWKRMRRRNP